MKTIALVGLAGVVLAIGLAVPALAHGTGGEGEAGGSPSAWEAMYGACAAGDWEAMAEAAEEVHEDYSDYMPCYGYYEPEQDIQMYPDRGDRWDGHMDGGMMRGRGGMMGWW
jgi:hypothetical protein